MAPQKRRPPEEPLTEQCNQPVVYFVFRLDYNRSFTKGSLRSQVYVTAATDTSPLQTTPKILDGKALSAGLEKTVASRVAEMVGRVGRKPGLGVILVGENPASKTYVASKEAFAARCGLETFDARLPDLATQQDVNAAVVRFNEDPRVDGILLQLPLPKHLDSAEPLRLIDPRKDADGLHPLNQGLLFQGGQGPRPCTPLGSMKLLDLAMCDVLPEEYAKIPIADLAGLKAVVIGRSQLVGKPVAMLLLERGATVTICHSKTKDLPGVTREADIVVAAVGIPRLVKGSWIKRGAVVIDVGINRLPDGKLTGDVDFEDAKSFCSAITPVPKGVGPMTVAMLIANTVNNYCRFNGEKTL